MSYSRKEIIGDCTLYLGDCLSLLDGLTADVVVSDPPYGINYVHGAEKIAHATKFSGVAVIGDDQPFDPAPLLKWPCVLWGANHFSARLPGGGRWLVWDKRENVGDGKSMSDVELAWVSGDRKADRIFRHLWDGFNRRSERGVPRVHPTQKPVALMEWCLDFLPPGGVVMDPFMGSGTTGVACVNQGRPFVGIEMDEGYFDISCQRIEAAYRQPRLFAEPAPRPVQTDLLNMGAS